MLTLFQRLANRRAMIVLTVVYILFPAVILPYAEAHIKAYSGGIGPIDLRFTYTPAEVFAMVAAYGEAGRAFYRMIELTADIAYPITYTLFFGTILTAALRRAFPATSWVQQIPLIGWLTLLVDFAENSGIVVMLTQFPAQNETIALVTSMFTTTKWVLFGTTVVSLLISLVTIVASKVMPKPKASSTA